MFTSLEIKAAAIVALVVALLIGKAAYDSHEQKLGAAPVLAGVQRASDAASAADAVRLVQIQSDQKEDAHEASSRDAARVADARSVDAVVQRLRDNSVRRQAGAPNPGAVGSSQAASLPGADVVPGELYRSALAALADTEQDLRDVAGYADCLRTGGQLCADDYAAAVK